MASLGSLKGGADPLDYRMRDAARAAVFEYLEVFHTSTTSAVDARIHVPACLS